MHYESTIIVFMNLETLKKMLKNFIFTDGNLNTQGAKKKTLDSKKLTKKYKNEKSGGKI